MELNKALNVMDEVGRTRSLSDCDAIIILKWLVKEVDEVHIITKISKVLHTEDMRCKSKRVCIQALLEEAKEETAEDDDPLEDDGFIWDGAPTSPSYSPTSPTYAPTSPSAPTSQQKKRKRK